MNTRINPENLFLNVAQVAARYGVSKDTVWRWSSIEELPKPVKIGPNATRWRLADLLDHESKFAASFAICFELVA